MNAAYALAYAGLVVVGLVVLAPAIGMKWLASKARR